MSTGILAGHRTTHARAYLPAFGVPWAEVSLDEEATLSGPVGLAIADLKFSGAVMSGGAGPVGRSSFRLAAGAGGWGRELAARSYANDAGVKASTVLIDAAREAGETLDASTVPEVRLGPAWAREKGPAARVLEHIFPSGWYVGEDGVTRIGRRPSKAFAAPTNTAKVDRARGTVSLAAETIAALVPGAVVEGIEAVDVLHELTPAGLRSTVWGPTVATTNRRLAAFRRMLEQLDPGRRYRGLYEYRIVTQDGERLNLQPVRASSGMPDLQRVPVRPGTAGTKAHYALGARVVVGFLDATPARPMVLGCEDADGNGFLALELDIDATTLIRVAQGVLAAARQTDPVQAGPFTGVITGPCSPKVRVG